jgi:transcriptional regulator with XRE-family HTH domain
MSDIGKKIKNVRKSRKLSGKKFSESLAISPSFLSHIEHGHKEPSRPLVHLIETKYGVSLREGAGPVVVEPTTVNERQAAYEARHMVPLPPDWEEPYSAFMEVVFSEDRTVKEALKQNLLAFQNSVRKNRDMRNMERRIDALEKRLKPEDPPGESDRGEEM